MPYNEYKFVDNKMVKVTKSNRKRKRKEDEETQTVQHKLKKQLNLNGWNEYHYNSEDVSNLNKMINDYKKIINGKSLIGWVSASKTKNYIMNDTCVDWLSMYYKTYGITGGRGVMTRRKSRNLASKLTNSSHLQLLFDGGNIFESKVYEELEYAYGEEFTLIFDENDYNIFSKERDLSEKSHFYSKYEETLEAMRNHVPIIAQAALMNHNNKTYGIADLVIRSDIISDLFTLHNDDEYVNIGAPAIGADNYHYRVIDCKWSTMLLCVDEETLRNNGLFKAYKSQVTVYTGALGHMQGYHPGYGYIMGKSWKIGTSKIDWTPIGETSIYKGYSAFDRLGIINYMERDRSMLQLTKKAIKWYQRCSTQGMNWRYNDDKPSVVEMYPNMSAKTMKFDSVKKKIAEKYSEITQLWYAGPRHREIAFSNGIFRLDDPNITPKLIGCTSSRARVMREILDINKKEETRLVLPTTILTNTNSWQTKNVKDYYVDFETINYNLFKDPRTQDIDNNFYGSSMTFMIGIGFETLENVNTEIIIDSITYDTRNDQCRYDISTDGKWEFVCFYLNSIAVVNEIELFRMFFNFIVLRNDIIKSVYKVRDSVSSRLFHWHQAEIDFMNNAIAKMRNDNYIKDLNVMFYSNSDDETRRKIKTMNEDFINEVIWIDMLKEAQKEPIVVKGSYKFSLKNYAKAFYNNDLINTVWDDGNLGNGFTAMMYAILLYREIYFKNKQIKDIGEYKDYMDIVKYNEIDCKVMWEIVEYLRENNCK